MSNTLDLRDDIDEIVDHHRTGFRKIERWYTTDGDPQEDTGLDKPPHEIFLSSSIEFLESAFEERTRDAGWVEDRLNWYRIFYAKLGISTEILLNAIVLKQDPDFYLSYIGDNESPKYKKLKNRLLHLVSKDTSDRARKRIVDVLKLVKIQRDNIVHINFHNVIFNNHLPRIYEVLAYLIGNFFSKDLEIVSALREKVNELDSQHAGLEYPYAEFPIN